MQEMPACIRCRAPTERKRRLGVDVTDLAIAGMDMVPGDRVDAAEMQIVVASPSIGNMLFAPPSFLR